MAGDSTVWVLQTLAQQGLTPLAPAESSGFVATGFTVADAGNGDAARVTVTARFTGQDAYDQWGEAQRLANQVLDALERQGAGFEEIDGREPNCVFDVYPPAGRATEK